MYDNYYAVADCWSSIVCFAILQAIRIVYKCVGDSSVVTIQDCVSRASNLICNCIHSFVMFYLIVFTRSILKSDESNEAN